MKLFWIGLLGLVLSLCPLQAEMQELVIGGDLAYPPYEFIDSEGKAVGYNVELSLIIAAELGMKPVFRLSKWARVREDLNQGRIDLVQGMAFSVDRAKTLHFSNPHANTWRALFVRKDSPFKSIEDMSKASILVQEGDIALDFFKGIGFEGNLVELPNQDSALHLLSTGTADAALLNYMHGMHQISQNGFDNVKALSGEILPRFYCMASHDPVLIDRINTILNKLQSNGKLAQLHNKWFGDYSPDLIFLNNRYRALMVYRVLFWIIVALIGLVPLGIYLLQKRKRGKAYAAYEELKQEYLQLKQDNTIFSKGPLIAYKHLVDPYRLLYISEGLRAWGYDPQVALARQEGYVDIVFSEDKPTLEYSLQQQIKNKEETRIHEYRIVTKSNEIRWVLDQNIIVYNPREEVVVYGYMVDITSQKNLEAELIESKVKAESANVTKEQFLATMSHEIRTPLNGILGFVQVLMQTKSTKEQKEYYQVIYDSGQNLMKIVTDVLDVSKIESGKMELVESEFDPAFLVRDLVKSFAGQRDKPGVDLRTKISDSLPKVLTGDMMRLRQIVINLLHNSFKFTDHGFIEVSAEVYNFTQTHIRILFSVKDTGIGIDIQKQQDIFDNFTQVDSQITRKYGGTGLGLSIVKRLVELMGGFIWVESKLKEGSSFFFIIPFKKPPEISEAIPADPPAAKPKEKLAPLHVLLVEDEVINQAATRRQLERWGLKVTVASNGAEAVGLCELIDFDCALMDIQMPVMDGVSATRKIREMEEGTGKHLIIYAYTALVMIGDRERFIEAGMDDYISKPVDLGHLYKLLEQVKPS